MLFSSFFLLTPELPCSSFRGRRWRAGSWRWVHTEVVMLSEPWQIPCRGAGDKNGQAGKGKNARLCFHLGRCKSCLTSSEVLHYMVAGGWLSAQGAAGVWGPGLCTPGKPQHLSAPELLQGQAALRRRTAKCTEELQGPWLSVWQHKTIFYG